MLDRDEDMMITGTRHPYLFRYKIGFTDEGLMKALDIKVYANAGNSIDLSGPVSDLFCRYDNNKSMIKFLFSDHL